MTENALCVDGRLTKIGTELDWTYGDYLAPRSIRTPGSDEVDLVFTPFHDRNPSPGTHQCFGHYDGRIRTDDGRTVSVQHLLGWAEQVSLVW